MALERLDKLAQKINAEHCKVEAAKGKVEAAIRNALQHAWRAGKLLVEAKEGMRHGEWLPWLEANFDGSVKTAQNYKRVYTRWADIEANAKSVADLTLTEALASIAPPQATATTQDQATAITRERVAGPLRRAGVEAGEEPTEEEDREPGVEAGEEPTEPSAQGNGVLFEDFSEWSSAERELLDTFREGEGIVVNMHDPGPHKNLVHWLEDTNQLTRADRKTEWGDPFILGEDGDRETVVRLYEEHYLPYKLRLQDKLSKMEGPTAWGCWCAPQPCHCDALKRVAEGGSSAEPKVEG